MKVGDKVRVTRVPSIKGLRDVEHLPSKTVFERCIGRVFPIIAITPTPENGSVLLELHVGEVMDEPAYMHSVWIEPECVELVGISN
jgi:hypothetical protein